MNSYLSKALLEARRIKYAPGCRVELVYMDDPYCNLKPGDRGRVEFVDDTGTVLIRWENGLILGAVVGKDQIKRVIEMSNAVREQILEIRASGETNMCDTNAVQRLAFERGFYDLVDFIEYCRKAYVHFILTGELP